MDIKRSGSQPSTKESIEYFTGTVRIDPLFEGHARSRAIAANVTFEPGARTARHTHPLGQTLIVTAAAVSCSDGAARSSKFDRET
jgi:quercetin dioxygenase-like cupin family protein